MPTRPVYIRGMVRLADATRRELAGPITAERLEILRQRVEEALAAVREIVAEAGVSTRSLPAPSRRANHYLANLDFSQVQTTDAAVTETHQPNSIRFNRLRAFLDRLLDDLATCADAGEIDSSYRAIHQTCETLGEHMHTQGIAPRHLKAESRSLWAWVTYFAERARFDAYTHAVLTAKPLMEAAASAVGRYKPPVLIHFRPAKSLYRVRGHCHDTYLCLPTMMIGLDADGFASLAGTVFGGQGNIQDVIERTQGRACQEIRVQLELLAGVDDDAAGLAHDLGAAFARVNARYFAGKMPQPRLRWNRHITGRKFGHYEHAADTVMVSATLDAADVPAYVVDFLVYHELLHKKHGVRWHNGRHAAHTPAFRHDERQFDQFAEAEAALKALAKRYS